METYLAAIVSYYLKPRTRFWTPGQRESTITITAPKIVEETRVRDITSEEATHRLSFLADIVDTGGYAIKGTATNPMRDDLIAEANTAVDMFETSHFNNLENTIAKDENTRHEEVMKEMRDAIDRSEKLNIGSDTVPTIQRHSDERVEKDENAGPSFDSPVVVVPGSPVVEEPVEKSNKVEQESIENNKTISVKPSIMELANNTDFSVATIAKEANRINGKDEGEVFIALH